MLKGTKYLPIKQKPRKEARAQKSGVPYIANYARINLAFSGGYVTFAENRPDTMKRSLHTFLLAVCCCVLATACTQRQERLKFMSYNIRNGRGTDNVQDIGRIAEIIDRTAPDIVALQEVDSATRRVEGRFIPGELGGMTGMHATFCRAIDYAGGGYGIGLLSRTAPLAVRRVPLPGREEARVLLIAEFPDYVVCVTHLSLTPEDRLASLPLIRKATDTCCKPVLLAGDFNMQDTGAVLEGLGNVFRMLSDTTQMTFPSDAPAVRIDYILGRGLPASAAVTESTVDHTTTASDHCPLWVGLAW